MIVIYDYSILMVTIFILSLGTLNAPSNEGDEFMDAETEENKIERQRLKCRSDISVIFAGNDVLEHGKTAIDYITRISPTTCYISFTNEVENGDINAYYSSFQPHLLIARIPKIQEFCEQYKGIVDEQELKEILEFLVVRYSTNRAKAIYKLFYVYKYRTFPSRLLPTVDGQEINIPLQYYEAMKNTFGVFTGEGGMLGPEDFCNDRYPLPPPV